MNGGLNFLPTEQGSRGRVQEARQESRNQLPLSKVTSCLYFPSTSSWCMPEKCNIRYQFRGRASNSQNANFSTNLVLD